MAEDMFLKFDGQNKIEGESKDAKHSKEIELLSYQHGANMPISITGTGLAGAGKVSVSEVVVTKMVESSSMKLWAAVCAGTHIGKAIISLRKQGNANQPYDYEVITLTDVVLSSLSESSAGGPNAMESMSLAFAKMEKEYYVQDNKGVSKKLDNMSYDLQTNAK